MSPKQLTIDVDPVYFVVGIYSAVKGGTQPGTKGAYAFFDARDELVPLVDNAVLYATRGAAERAQGLFDVFEFDPKRDGQCHDCRAIVIQTSLTEALDLAGTPRRYCMSCRRQAAMNETRWQAKRAARRAT